MRIITKRPRRLLLAAGLGVGAVALGAGIVIATVVVDLTAADSTATINSAVYTQGLAVPVSGTGVLDPFLRISDNQDRETGISTDSTKVLNNDDSWTKALLLSNIPVIQQGGTKYREFVLDINQTNNNPLLSLDELKLFLTSTPNITSYTDGGLTGAGTVNGILYPAGSGIGHMVFSQGDNIVKLDYSLAAGSGKPDMTVLIPDSVFAGPDYCGYAQAGCNTWMGFFSSFGAWNGTNITGGTSAYPNNDGFEEWATIIRPVVNVTKTATATSTKTCTWDITKDVDKTEIDIAQGGTATFNYTVSVTHSCTDSTPPVTGNIVITNPATLPDGTKTADATINSVTDLFHPTDNSGDVPGTVSCGTVPFTLGSGQSKTCTYSLALASPKDGTNTATVTLSDTSVAPTTAQAAVTFTSTVVDGSVTVVDDKTNPGSPVTLGTVNYTDPSPKTFTYSLNKSGVAGTCTDYTNTATFTTNTTSTTGSADQTVTVCVGKDLTVSKTATGSKDRTYNWLIDKSVDKTEIDIAEGGTATFNYSVKVTPDGFDESGFTLGGTITVTNPNDWEDITLTALTDTLDQGGTCTITESAPYVVPKSDSLTVHYTCTTDGTTTKNTATATWDKAAYFTPTGSASGDAAVTFALGTETNKVITVIDDKTDPQNPVTLGTWDWADGAHTFTYSLDKSGVAGTCTDYTNTAVIEETQQSDDQTVTVCVGKDLTVSKTATPAFTRTYAWDITKDVDQTSVTINNGDSATFSYTVSVSHDDGTDSAWATSGSITVTNPNDWEAITFDLADAVDNGGTCSITGGGTGISVAASDSVTKDYTCTWASAPSSASGTNTATATWNKDTYHTPTGTADGTADFTFDTPTTTTDECVTVTDPVGGGTLGTACVGVDPNPKTFTYSRTVTPADYGNTCGTTTYDNTATFTTNDTSTTGSASQTVSVEVINCGVPGKTPGFWGNKNGHAILDPGKDGNLDTPVSIGAGSHIFNVTTIAQSDKILRNNDCVAGTPVIFTCTGSTGLLSGLNTNTFEELGAQTLAITYNINNISGYTGQTINSLSGCSYVTSALQGLGLTCNSTVNQVLTVANNLIGNSFKPSGTATQTQEGNMNALLSWLNRETL